MSTLFNITFTYKRLGKPTFDVKGREVAGALETRTVKGSIQALEGKDLQLIPEGSRDIGSVKIYASERLDTRSQQGEFVGYVQAHGRTYELTDELGYTNNIIAHYKYLAKEIPQAQIPEALL